MHFITQIICIIIFTTLFPNIVTKLKKSSTIETNKYIEVDTKKNNYDTKSKYSTNRPIKQTDNEESNIRNILLIVCIMSILMLITDHILYRCKCIRRSMLIILFNGIRNCCWTFTFWLCYFRNINPPPNDVGYYAYNRQDGIEYRRYNVNVCTIKH